MKKEFLTVGKLKEFLKDLPDDILIYSKDREGFPAKKCINDLEILYNSLDEEGYEHFDDEYGDIKGFKNIGKVLNIG